MPKPTGSVESFLKASNQQEQFQKLNADEKKLLTGALATKLATITETQDYFIANNQYKDAQKLDTEIALLKKAMDVVKPSVDNRARALAENILSAPESERKDRFDSIVDFSKNKDGITITTSDELKQKVREEFQHIKDELIKEKSTRILPDNGLNKKIANVDKTIHYIEPESTNRMKPK